MALQSDERFLRSIARGGKPVRTDAYPREESNKRYLMEKLGIVRIVRTAYYDIF
jgi:hypothetical protein